jgi:hypothetical protein
LPPSAWGLVAAACAGGQSWSLPKAARGESAESAPVLPIHGGYFLLNPLAVDSARADIEAAWSILSDPDRRAAYDRPLGLPAITLLPSSATTSTTTTTAPMTAAAPTTPPTPTTLTPTRTPSLKFLAPVIDDRPRAPATPTPPSPATPTSPATTAPATTAPATALPKTTSPPPFPTGLFALDGEVNGQVLKKLREARGLTLDQLSEQTKIRRPYLLAIEDQELENLPARVYLRGFLTQIARVLRVDAARLADGYLAFVARFGR